MAAMWIEEDELRPWKFGFVMVWVLVAIGFILLRFGRKIESIRLP